MLVRIFIAAEKVRIQIHFYDERYEKILFGCFMYPFLPTPIWKNQEWLRASA